MEDIVMRLIDLVEKTSPLLWTIAKRQVYAEIMSDVIWLVVLLALIVGFCVLANWLRRQGQLKADAHDSYGDEDGDFEKGFGIASYAAAFFISLVFVGVLTTVVTRLMNPDYAAISVLTKLIK